jgi:hypothetical protein
MFINQIDELIDNILNNFNDYINNIKIFKKIYNSVDYVKYQNDIIDIIKNFINNINKKTITDIIKELYYDIFINIIKKYCAFYIYLSIAYHYSDSKDMYITNLLECGKLQSTINYDMDNFFNSNNNSKIINYFVDIKNILSLLEIKSFDKIKILLSNNIIKYESTILIFNEFGEDYIKDYFMIENNFYNIIKTIILKLVYLKEDKQDLLVILQQQEIENAEYRYIDVIISNDKKIINFNLIEKFLNLYKYPISLADEIYNYISDTINTNELILLEMQDYINYLFNNKIIIPITEDFVRYHKDTEKYNPQSIMTDININIKEATQIKYIIYKMNNIINYYSPLISSKLKLETKQLFFKQFENRLAVLYNNDIEIKIIKKLKLSEKSIDYDLLIDLLNLRKYSYLNFKNLSKDGIKINTTKTTSCIRYTNILDKTKKLIETRICNDNIDTNIVGIAINNSHKMIDFIYNTELINIRKDQNNGFNEFIKHMNLKKNNKIYYWLFDTKYDEPKSNTYINYNVNDVQNNIKLMINEIYNYYINIKQDKFINYINNYKNLTFLNLNLFLYKNRNFFNIFPNIKNNIIQNAIFNKIKHIDINASNYYIEPIKSNIINLPIIKSNIKNKSDKLIYINNDNLNTPICYHYIKWNKIMSMAKNTEQFTQSIFDFAKQYIKINNDNLNICKSCGELLNIEKYVVTGTHIEELDTFLTTNIGVNQNLEDINTYAKYTRSIRNIDKIIEKIASATSNNIYIGNDNITKLKRRLLVKDIIDFLLIHTEWGKKSNKTRKDEYNHKYGINKELSNLFFFELKDDIFLTSSTDTDQYKIFKYNNIIIYIIFFIILELNSGQLMFFKTHKIFNYLLFTKIQHGLFDKLFIRLNQKEKISLIKLPVLCYIIFYFSGIIINSKIWLYNTNIKNKLTDMIDTQKIIIHTFIDFINTIIEAHIQNNKSYLYQNISNRFNIKINSFFNNNNLLNELNNIPNTINTVKNIKIEYININDILEPLQIETKIYCMQPITIFKKNNIIKSSNLINKLSNCISGNYHKWSYSSTLKSIECLNCKKLYINLINDNDNDNSSYLDKLNLYYLELMSKKYCINGKLHELNDNNICSKCNININEYNFTNDELLKLEENLEKNNDDEILFNINKFRKNNKKNEIKNDKIIKFITKFNNKFYNIDNNITTSDNTNNEIIENNNFELYVSKFINNLINIIGNKIKINDKLIYLDNTYIIIDHNYESIKINPIEKPLSFFVIDENNSIFNKDIIYYKDTNTNFYIYYDYRTLQYLGYSQILNTNITFIKSYNYLKMIYSIKDCILLMGFENQYINLFHIDKEYNEKSDINDLIYQIIRIRINNLKQILSKIKTIIYNIKNKNNNLSISNTNNIINEFSKKINNIQLHNKKHKGTVFNNSEYIINNLNMTYNNYDNIKLNNHYINIKYINELNNTDIKIIYYIIYHLNRIIKYNNHQDVIILIINIIKFIFDLYYISYSNINIRKFDYLLLHDPPYDNNLLQISGIYDELSNEEINDEARQEELYDEQEAKDALDMDDYEVDDEFDERMENIGE